MKVHWSGVFLPFHRLYISAYEKALNECGWEGGQPYWSWSMVRPSLLLYRRSLSNPLR